MSGGWDGGGWIGLSKRDGPAVVGVCMCVCMGTCWGDPSGEAGRGSRKQTASGASRAGGWALEEGSAGRERPEGILFICCFLFDMHPP